MRPSVLIGGMKALQSLTRKFKNRMNKMLDKIRFQVVGFWHLNIYHYKYNYLKKLVLTVSIRVLTVSSCLALMPCKSIPKA